ncbi:MAG TPA: fibronectin type III domain-containing protein, partial [Anaerolineales bacterium]|nr:fibronectin type III domain-containing protein [Anaerolineales bacterium]
MQRSFKNLFMIILILVTSIASGLNVVPARAVGALEMVGLPSLPGTVTQGYLNSMWGANATNIFSVGYANTGTFTPSKPLIYQTANGTTWNVSIPPLPTTWETGSLEAVWGMDMDPNHAIAVGMGSPTTSSLPLASFWDGTSWTPDSPDLPSTSWTSGELHGVWGSSLSNVYAVGYGGGNGFTNMPLISHWDGTNWTSQGLTLPGGYTHAYLVDIWGYVGTSTHIYAAGRGLDASANDKPLLYHSTNGTTWTSITLLLPTTDWVWGKLDGIWGSGPDDIYAVGTGNNGSMVAPLIYHWNGSVWNSSEPSLPATTWNSGYLYSVWGIGADVYAAGYGYNAKPGVTMTSPLVYRKTSNGWIASSYPPSGWASGHFQSIWGYGANNVYAVGYGNDRSFDKPLLAHAGSDTTAPGAVVALGASLGTSPASVKLQWTAPADDGPNPPDPNAGPVTSYLVKYSEADNLTSCDDPDGTPVTSGLPVPVKPGTTQTMTVTGLTASSTYFFSVCAKDEENNLSDVATVSGMSASSGLGAGIYDDTDGNWTYTGTWTASTQTGPYNNTLHYGTSGSDARMTFDGVRFTLTYVKASNRGLIDVYVDGAKIGTINAYNSTTLWQQTWTSPTFALGVHTVRFAYGGGSTYIDIDKIQIFGVASAGVYDDVDVNWAYVGTWQSYNGAGPYNTTQHYTTVGNQAQFTFNGVKFALTYLKASSRGLIDVYVDGKKIARINAKSTTLAWQQVWSSPFLNPGIHTVRFVHAGGGTYIDIDKIEIFEGMGPGIYDDPNSNWRYTGTWTIFTGAGPYNNTNRYSSKVGSEAQFAFNGVRFKLTYVKATNRGLIDVYVDGVKVDRINA